MTEVVVIELPEMDPETMARMDVLCQEAFAALRADVGTVVDLANLARAAWERENARPGGRRRVVIQRVPRAELSAMKPSATKTTRRSAFAKSWGRRRARTDEERSVWAQRRAAQRARLSDQEREAANRRQTELRHATEAAMSADALQAKRAARREADRAREAALSPEEREARRRDARNRKRAKYAAMSDDERAARQARQAAAYQRRKGTGA